MLKITTKKVLFSAIVLCIALILGFCAAIILKKYYTHKTINQFKAGYKVLNTINTYFIQDRKANLAGKPVEERGLYKVDLTLDNVTQSFYLTKDGELLIFPGAVVDIAKLEKVAQHKSEIKKEEIPKADKPEIELFIMSLCPYGSRAEKEILPIVKPFGDRIDFKIKFIANINGNTINDVNSLRGIDEAKEDGRQAAIMKYYPDKFAAYVDKVNEKACVISCGAVKLDDYWKEAALSLQMDVKKIEKFAYSEEAMVLLKENSAASSKYNAYASPTLIINGAKSEAIYKGAEAIKEAICSAFTNAPSVCQKEQAGS